MTKIFLFLAFLILSSSFSFAKGPTLEQLYGKGLYNVPPIIRLDFEQKSKKSWHDSTYEERASFLSTWQGKRTSWKNDAKNLEKERNLAKKELKQRERERQVKIREEKRKERERERQRLEEKRAEERKLRDAEKERTRAMRDLKSSQRTIH